MRSVRGTVDGGGQYEHTVRQLQDWVRTNHSRVDDLQDQLARLQIRVEQLEKAPADDGKLAISTSMAGTTEGDVGAGPVVHPKRETVKARSARHK